LVELFAETIVEELDFRLEAENMIDIARVLAETNQRSTIVPRPHPTLVTKRVLVMERLDGFRFDAVADMHAAGVDTHAVVRAGMVAFLEGAILHGVFHGDLHGGNMFVRPDGKIALLDFGITGRLSTNRRSAFLRLLIAGSSADPHAQLEALRDLGALPLDTDIAAVVRDLELDKPSKDPTKMSADELTKELQNITKGLLSYGARFPKELMLFVKNMLFLDGAMATMAPEIDLFEEIANIAMWFATQHGERIAGEMGLALSTDTIDTASMKRSVGIDPDEYPTMTYRDLQKRRAIIQGRLQPTKKSAPANGRTTSIRRARRRP
jgi:ubiquinone biosynthesis protein